MNALETIADQLARHADKPMLIEMHGASSRAAEGSVVGDLVSRARGTLHSRGVQPGDRIALIAPNSIRWVAADLAMLFEGAVVVPMYARQDPDEVRGLLAHAKPTMLVVADAEVRDLYDGVSCEVLTFEDLFQGGLSRGGPPVHRDADSPVTVIYTSGTSGEPKGVVLTLGNVDFMLPCTRDALGAMMGPSSRDDRVFHYLPFCFAGSRIVLWTCLFRGNPLHMSTNLDRLVDEMKGARPNYFLNVPMLLERIKNGVEGKIADRGPAIAWLWKRAMKAGVKRIEGRAGRRDRVFETIGRSLIFEKVREQIGPELRCLICGSAPLGEATQHWFEVLGLPVYQVYGLTETTAIVTMDVPPTVVAGRVGSALEGVETRLGEGDELLVRGPNIFSHYLDNPEATEAAFDNGWFRTGDQAEVDEDGNWRIIGRVKNLLVPSSGHNVAPEPLEQVLLEGIPGADAAVVVGHGRPHLTALISGEDVQRDAVQGVIDELNGSLPHYKRVRAYRIVDDPFTIENGLLTANRKLRRRVIEDAHRTTIEAMYA